LTVFKTVLERGGGIPGASEAASGTGASCGIGATSAQTKDGLGRYPSEAGLRSAGVERDAFDSSVTMDGAARVSDGYSASLFTAIETDPLPRPNTYRLYAAQQRV
ncbi:MAG: hypothetical protein V3S33_01130, partial [Gammaproteobacteria bacterium]